MESGDELILYTDGVKEATNSEKKVSSDGQDIEFLKAALQSNAKSVIANINWAEMYYGKEDNY